MTASGSAKCKVEEVDVIPCPKEPCELKRGNSYTVEVRFIPSKDSRFCLVGGGGRRIKP